MLLDAGRHCMMMFTACRRWDLLDVSKSAAVFGSWKFPMIHLKLKAKVLRKEWLEKGPKRDRREMREFETLERSMVETRVEGSRFECATHREESVSSQLHAMTPMTGSSNISTLFEADLAM